MRPFLLTWIKGVTYVTLEMRFRQNCQRWGWADPKQHGLIAVSTGVDSMVLLTLFMRLPANERPQLSVVHVNHHLREQSRTEEAFLKKWCAVRQIPVTVADWTVDQHPDHGTEAAAREFRYAFFGDQLTAQSADWVATAHQADEQAETILLKLIRGGQLDQLTGMAPQRPFHGGAVIHPLLPFRKSELKAYAREQHIPWYEDITNQELEASRNRVRHEIMPLLRRENPQIDRHLIAYAGQLSATLQVTDHVLDRQLATIITPTKPLTGEVSRLLSFSSADQRLLLARLLKRASPMVTTNATMLDQCLQLLANPQHPTGSVEFGAGWRFSKRYQQFQFTQVKKKRENSQEDQRFMVVLNQWQPVGDGWQIGCFTVTAEQKIAAADQVALRADQLPLRVRPWRSSDQLRLADGHHQSVRRLLINAKVPRDQRDRQRVLVTAEDEVLTVIGVKWAVIAAQPQANHYHVVIKHE